MGRYGKSAALKRGSTKDAPDLAPVTLIVNLINMYEHLSKIAEKITSLKVIAPPSPWQHISTIAIGGLTSVGFDRDSDILLIVSCQGRGVIDCLTGEKLARDEEDYCEDRVHLEAEGIGPLSGRTINVAGLHGGGLPTCTGDMWILESVTVKWPEANILLVEPGSDLYGSNYSKPDNFHKVGIGSEIRAYGFSQTGKSFIIASSSEISIYAR